MGRGSRKRKTMQKCVHDLDFFLKNALILHYRKIARNIFFPAQYAWWIIISTLEPNETNWKSAPLDDSYTTVASDRLNILRSKQRLCVYRINFYQNQLQWKTGGYKERNEFRFVSVKWFVSGYDEFYCLFYFI